MLKRIVTTILFGAVIAGAVPPSLAATIESEDRVLEGKKITFIYVEGELFVGDERRFANKAISADDGIVLLSSPGGNLAAGIEIGKAIRLKGFATFVPKDFSCASACALAWLGGRVRLMGKGARIGFHAASSGAGESNSVGNAVMGAYLNQLGLPLAAIAYISEANPTDVRWLTLEDAAKIGIEVRAISLPDGESTPEPAPSTKDQENDWSSYGEWIQLFSRSAQSEAIEIGRQYLSHFENTRVFEYDNGWYVVVIGPYIEGTADGVRRRLMTSGRIPRDSLVSKGARFLRLAWGEAPALPAQSSEAPGTGAYLFDLLKRPDYRSAWVRMFENEKSMPSWIDPTGVNFEGVSGPSKEESSLGLRYLVSWSCKPHDCKDNQLIVLYLYEEKKAVGLLKVGPELPRWFGHPSNSQQEVLLGAVN